MTNADKVFRALADPGRRLLLDKLFRENGQSLNSLCRDMDMSRQAVSQHIEILEDANLVVSLKEGRERLHYINPVPIHEAFSRWIRKCETQRITALANFKRDLERRPRREKRKTRVRDLHPHHSRSGVDSAR